jgi:hypothetical protein
MGIGIGIGLGLSSRRAEGLSPDLLAKFELLWEAGYNGDNLQSIINSDVITVTGKDWTGKFIPETTSATFAVPNNATYLACDGTDDFLFDDEDTLIQNTFADLIGYDPQRTFIKYSDFEPYEVSKWGILKADAVLTDGDKNELSRYFKLHIMYFDEWNDYGYNKDNVGYYQRATHA